MFRRSAAAAADDVQEARLRPFANLRRHGVSVQIVFTKGVRQPGIRVRSDIAFGNARQLLHVLAQLIWPQRAVQAEGERIGMTQGVIKGFGGLPGERTPGGVGDGTGDHDRQFNAQRLKLLFHGEDRRFSIQGIEHGLDQNQVNAPFHQRFGGLAVSLHQPIKGNIAVGWVVNIRGNRGGAVGRAEHARDVARFFRRAGSPLIGAGARQLCRDKVDFRRQGFHLVIRHRDSRRVKGVGFNDIRPRLKVGVMDSGYHIRLTEHQQIVIAFQIAWPVGKAFAAEVLFTQTIALDHGAHAPIQNQNTFF